MKLWAITRAVIIAAAVAAATVALCVGPAFGAPATPSATLAPHVPTEYDTDVCAMCHRSHTGASDTKWVSAAASDTKGSALIVGTSKADTGLCYSCHGVDSLGSAYDVQSAFEASSGHSLDPTSSAFGPSPKQCSSCHDSHGSARSAPGVPFARLLRAITSTGTPVYRGNEYCGSCHTVRAGSSFHGLAVFDQTLHASKIAPPSSGTGIVCDACHNPHGSNVAPALRSRLETPSVSTPTTITANDRRFCLACHSGADGTWGGGATYRAAHASSAATVAIPGTWAPPGSARRVGECQVCHNATGATDASGALVPTLLAVKQPELCYGCHRAAGPAASNLASQAYSPTTPGNEVIAVFPSVADAGAYSALQVYSREDTAAGTPVGPRQPSPFAETRALATGDIDGDGLKEAIVSDGANARVAIVSADPLKGTQSKLVSLPLPADPAVLMSVGDVFVDGSGLPEVVTVNAAGVVDVLRYSAGSLVRVASATVGGTPTGLAVGNVVGSSAADIAVTTTAGLYILTENGATLSVGGPYGTGAQPVGVAIGNAWTGSANEVVVAYAGEVTDVLSIFDGAGAVLGSGGGPLPAGSATAVLVGDVLPNVTPSGTSGAEIVLAFADPSGDSGIRVFEQLPAGGLGPALGYVTGTRANPSGLALGDADGDGKNELLIALGGAFTRTATSVAPSLHAYRPVTAGDALESAFSLPSGGVEMASTNAAVAIADMGAVGPSRHAVGAVKNAHVSTETVAATRHVECSDCHDSHLASVAASSTVKLPGSLIGARGVVPENVDASTVNLSGPTTATADYEVCFKCHSKWSPTAPRSIASEVNTLALSFHPVEGSARPTNATGVTLTGGMTVGGTVKCVDCHGTSLAGAPAGPHASAEAPLLSKRYFGAAVSDTTILCYRCHQNQVYLSGTDDGTGTNRSGFYDSSATAPKQALHSYHAGMGLGCESCHVTHGSADLPYLLRSTGFVWSNPAGPVDGECSTACHTGGVAHGYRR